MFIFSQIKNEYEINLSNCKEKIRELEPLKALLVTVSERCDQKIQKIREEVIVFISVYIIMSFITTLCGLVFRFV